MKNRFNLLFIIFLVTFAGLACMESDGNNAQNSQQNTEPQNANVIEQSDAEDGGGKVDLGDPSAIVADLYKQHDAKKGPFAQSNRARVDKYFTKPFADLIYIDNTKPADEIGALGADPLYDGQDFEIKNFKVGKAIVNSDTARVPVTFENFGEKKTVSISLLLVNNAWKISDIKYESAGSLYKILKDEYTQAKTNAPPVKNVKGEFEGTFNIGTTTCTVTPVKMAFEIRWAKGKGSEMFFYKDGNTFESEPDDSGNRNEFRFDDENYNSGVFVRTDGQTMPISRPSN